MLSEVRLLAPHPKKLFEWDAEKHMLAIVVRDMLYQYYLSEEGSFQYISDQPKPLPKPPPRE